MRKAESAIVRKAMSMCERQPDGGVRESDLRQAIPRLLTGVESDPLPTATTKPSS
jgi:hypothetical protein